MRAKIFLISLVYLLMMACSDQDPEKKFKKEMISGLVQKGPYNSGSIVTLYDLSEKLSHTGITYQTSVLDNTGKFEFKDILLSSGYVLLSADGFFFNECAGETSASTLRLNAIADVSIQNTVNINILTHLSKDRIENLVGTNGMNFNNARSQALREILSIFSLEKEDIRNADLLNIAENHEDHAVLMAASVILMGMRSTGELSELMGSISSDMKVDGVLNDSTLGSCLINDARLVNQRDIRENIENRYDELGNAASLSDFESYMNQFIEDNVYKITKIIEYPARSEYGRNMLYDTVTQVNYTSPGSYTGDWTMAAFLPEGTNLKIVLKGGEWLFPISPNGPVNWTFSKYLNESQTFTVEESGKTCDMKMFFISRGTITVEYYENNSETPTRIKQVKVK